ncbi:hypothetical protein [Tenacibaculum singaporense]|uniref:Bacteriocin n=1 Tax=Tenacibaculum singaporense TaxID=2358479 RepID=A0A3S8R5W3_9FLAO|nr:hypothetical protein [Tenacibaculum singaporense]AZJ35148.1 hypothetical protein D6T69_06270 [Tenacibaculum singaporense]RSC93430.1 hypothetical protein EI424_09440 [Tenacibaculum singaporense]
MKKSILNLGKELTKTDQKQVNGGIGSGSCTGSGSWCCVQTQWGEFCDAGRCTQYGCIWY